MNKYFLIAVFSLCFFASNAQNPNDEVLFTVENDPVYVSEFTRVFNKNIDLVKDESQKDVDEYLKLFINYKLKLKEAEALGLDKKPSYLNELSSYKSQLASNYLTDSKVTDELIEEAYKRMTTEVDASHILIRLDDNPTPEDTLQAYNKLLKLRDRVMQEGFETVKKDIHNGKTVYAEDLGYFSAFKMVYNFETAAYNTPVGEVSMPFKTRFGYHIVWVKDKRESRGERTVAHIMISNQKKDRPHDKPESRINDIYLKLQQGEDFEALAKQFSEDQSSASKGGMLAPFTGGQLSSVEFENQAFALEHVGDISKPFETEYGWHIIKLYGKKPVASFEDMKAELEEKVKRDSRSQLINESLLNNLKQQYQVSDATPDLSYFESILNDNYFIGKWVLPTDFKAQEPLIKIQEKQIVYEDFGQYLVKNQRRQMPKMSIKTLVVNSYHAFLENELLQYKKERLEVENQDYAYIVEEYRDGLLLFDLMETEIWNAAKKDSVGLQTYYNNHKDNYFWNQRVDAVVASSAKKTTIKKVQKLLQNNQTPEQIKAAINSESEIDVIFTSGIMDAQHQSLPADFKFKTGVSDIYKFNEGYIVANVKEVLPKETKSFEEAKGAVISDFQNHKEANWILSLEEKYQVNVNQDVLERVKKQLNK
ncbi:MAG: peptidylprolyl isomerase [Xanthomarina sp.]|uniref:peptidylprolyl isomerase n=1 Tax=Xanthomarina sp. TaxID=1931211 RepID=UPI000C4F2ADA|nr:peptidylprolyl isomerase [Xanthomarina sp.]MAL22627.1 peptidylprolyl isomerase [Xanthomarina sp.]MBF62962.1 peptidylprolyl isomerase [Xanthomarina sp.]HAB28115.1 peptidylprolyl isomerase [Xanthomarina gelatinilytica]HAI20001.1 peptidylprolyl isomerase [Xanthomarina gelatinilytica]|tara:strand:+ start:511 stop:2460 length:1950 start_codon:yes stop_codon:yes gene_type:complete